MLPAPKSAAFVYGPDRDLSTHVSRLEDVKVVVCVRDIRNLLASRLKHNETTQSQLFRVDMMLPLFWTQYAQQVLGAADVFGVPYVGIVYDKWFLDEKYRARTVDRLNKAFGWELEANLDLGEVVDLAGGSSFDGTVIEAREMKVTTRWEEYKNHPIVKKLLTPEVLALNTRLLEI